MKLSEIREDKDKFVGNLKDPAAQELSDIIEILNRNASRGYRFKAVHADKELATILGRPPGMEIETREGNIIEYIKRVINTSKHWSWKTNRGDVEEEFAVYVVRKA